MFSPSPTLEAPGADTSPILPSFGIDATRRHQLDHGQRDVVAAAAGIAGCQSTRTQESTGQYLDDTAITGKVKAAIFNEPTLKSAEINVETFKGAVQLSGFVGSAADIAKAVSITQNIAGVRSVKNDMRLK